MHREKDLSISLIRYRRAATFLISAKLPNLPQEGQVLVCSGGKSRQSPQVSLSLCESAREISGARAIRPQPQQKGGGCRWWWRGQVRETLSSSDLLFFLGLKTPTLFHPQLYAQRNRKRLHHSIHPSSLPKRPVTIIDLSLSLLTASNASEPERYTRQ